MLFEVEIPNFLCFYSVDASWNDGVWHTILGSM